MKEERTSSPLLRRTGQHTATATGWPWTFLPFFILTLCWDNQCLTSGHLSFRGVRALQTDGVAARPRRRAQKVSTEESELWWQGNQRFDPDADQSAGKEEMQCDIPPYQGESRTSNNNLPYTKSVSYCTSDGQSDFSSLTDSQLDTLAQLYAPVLFFHPEEPNTMETVNATFDDPENGDIIYDGNNPQGTEDIFWPRLDLDVLLDTTRNYTLGLDKESYYFQHVLTSQYRSGAGYDPDSGRSRAPIYYNIWKNDTIAAGGYWVINYHMYYTYRGSASMGVSSTWNNRTSLRTFVLRPFGEHEGDWQTLSVAICPPPTPEVTPWSQQQLSPPLTVTFSQNEWRTTLDCTLGDCLFYKEMDATGQSEEGSIGNYHPVAFVAQRTHTMYPSSAAMMIYKEFQFNFIFRLQGIVGLDRVSYRKQLAQGQTNTTAPPYRYFLPNATNILRIRNPSEINPLTTPTMDKWMGFAGRWGGTSLFDLDFNYTLGGRYKRNANELLLRFEAARNLVERLSIFPTPPPICYDIYGSNIIPCPTKDEDPPFNNVMEMLNSFTIDAVVDSLIFGSTLAFRSVYLFFTGTGNGPRGPATQANFLAFRKAENAPLWDNSGMSVEVDGSKETRPITGAEYCQNLVTTNPFTLQSTSEPIDLYSNAIGMIVLCVLLAVGNIVAFVHPRFRGQSVPPLLFDPQTAEVSIHPKARIAILRPAIIYTVFLVVMIVGVIVYFVGYSVLVRLLNDMTDGNVGILPYAAFVIGLFVLLIDIVMAICIWIGTLGKFWMLYEEILSDHSCDLSSHRFLILSSFLTFLLNRNLVPSAARLSRLTR